jgi:LPS export ABC transporter protein LptC
MTFFTPAAPAFRPVLLCVSAALLLSVSCTFDYDELLLSDEQKEQIPDVQLTDLVERVYQEGDRVLELSSDVLRTYEERRSQEIEGLSFSQYTADGELSVSGRADFASRNLEFDDIYLQGNVEISLEQNSSRIRGDQFVYSSTQELVWAPAGVEVELILNDGSVLRGNGFVADLILMEMRFDNGASGIISGTSGDQSDEQRESE